MKRINNKGITTVEVIISFVLVVIIATSLYSTIVAYNNKRLIESYKSEIYQYKNLITKMLQDDFIKKGLTSVTYNKYTGTSSLYYKDSDYGDSGNGPVDANTTVYQLDCTLKDGTNRRLVIIQRFARSATHLSGSDKKNDYFSIEYGVPDLTKASLKDQNAKLVIYELPDLGQSGICGSDSSMVVCSKGDTAKRYAKDLTINNVLISFGNDSVSTNTNVLSLYIGFYHPELSTRYGINIVSPVNYTTSSSGENNYLFSDITSTDDSSSGGSSTGDISTSTIYSIKLNGMSATSAGTTTLYETYGKDFSLTSGGTSTTKISVPTKTGYTFAGYYDVKSTETNNVISNTSDTVEVFSDDCFYDNINFTGKCVGLTDLDDFKTYKYFYSDIYKVIGQAIDFDYCEYDDDCFINYYAIKTSYSVSSSANQIIDASGNLKVDASYFSSDTTLYALWN